MIRKSFSKHFFPPSPSFPISKLEILFRDCIHVLIHQPWCSLMTKLAGSCWMATWMTLSIANRASPLGFWLFCQIPDFWRRKAKVPSILVYFLSKTSTSGHWSVAVHSCMCKPGYIGIYTHTFTRTHVHTYVYSKREMTEYSNLYSQNVFEPNAIVSPTNCN